MNQLSHSVGKNDRHVSSNEKKPICLFSKVEEVFVVRMEGKSIFTDLSNEFLQIILSPVEMMKIYICFVSMTNKIRIMWNIFVVLNIDLIENADCGVYILLFDRPFD